MKKSVSIISLLCIYHFLPFAEVRAQDNALPLSVATIGQFHSDEITIEDGDSVLVFGVEQGHYSLKSNLLKIERVEDVIWDENDTPTGKLLSLQNDIPDFKPQIILRGDILAEGVLKNAVVVQDCIEVQDKKTPCDIKFNDESYAISVKDYPTADRDDPAKNFVADIVIEHENKHTFIGRVNKIIWAGDLDRDGALDLIIDGRDHYNVDPDIKIYLSSLADKSSLFELAGFIRAVGC